MAILIIKKYKNNNDKSAAFGKTYGRLVHQDTMNTSDLCRHMMKHGHLSGSSPELQPQLWSSLQLEIVNGLKFVNYICFHARFSV